MTFERQGHIWKCRLTRDETDLLAEIIGRIGDQFAGTKAEIVFHIIAAVVKSVNLAGGRKGSEAVGVGAILLAITLPDSGLYEAVCKKTDGEDEEGSKAVVTQQYAKWLASQSKVERSVSKVLRKYDEKERMELYIADPEQVFSLNVKKTTAAAKKIAGKTKPGDLLKQIPATIPGVPDIADIPRRIRKPF